MGVRPVVTRGIPFGWAFCSNTLSGQSVAGMEFNLQSEPQPAAEHSRFENCIPRAIRREVDRWANGQCGPAAWHLPFRSSLVVHRSADDPSVYSLSHAPFGRSIPTEATGSPDPLIELANRLSRMTEWAALGATRGIDELSPGSGGESSGSSTGSTVGSGWGRRRPRA